MKGKIVIEQVEIKMYIGVTQEERRQEQSIFVDLVVEYDMKRAVETQHIEDALDYEILQKRVMDFKEKEYILVEKLCNDIVMALLSDFEQIGKIACTVWKPNAAVHAQRVGVEIVRER